NVAVAVALFVAGRGLVSRGVAAAIAITWILLPNHATLEHWASALNIVVCLLLLLVGVVALERRRDAVAIVCFVASSLSYEASIAAAALAVLAVPWILDGRPRRRTLVAGWAALAAVGVWTLIHTAPGRTSTSKFADFSLLYRIHFGAGITTTTAIGVVLGAVAAVGPAVAF